MQESGNEVQNLSDVSVNGNDDEQCDTIKDIPDFAVDDFLNTLNLIFDKDPSQS